MATRKRDKLEIIRDVLKAIRENRQIKPTRLLYASNLSPQMFKEYINELVSKGFITLDVGKDERKIFALTMKGHNFLQEYRLIEDFVDNFGL